MSWPWTLYRYLASQFLVCVGAFFAGLSFLTFSIDLVDLFNRTAGKHVPNAAVVGMSLLQLPSLALKLLPFAVLFGGVFAFIRLSRSQELLAIRAAGVSAWNLLAPPLAVAIGLGVLTVTVFTPVSATLLVEFTALEAKYIRGQASQLDVSENGLWLRQGDYDEQSVVHALRVADQGARLDDVVIFLFGGSDKFRGRIEARSATLIKGAWVLDNAWVSEIEGRPVHHASYNVPTTLTRTSIQESFAPPETLSFWALPGFIQAAQRAGFRPTRYLMYFDTLLALPAMFAAMVFMAASFSLRLARLGGLGRIIVQSALAGFGVYFFSTVTQGFGIHGILPVALAAAAPATAAILIGMTLVFHQEDG
jgi:lipopolysaccharide export system permease protein